MKKQKQDKWISFIIYCGFRKQKSIVKKLRILPNINFTKRL